MILSFEGFTQRMRKSKDAIRFRETKISRGERNGAVAQRSLLRCVRCVKSFSAFLFRSPRESNCVLCPSVSLREALQVQKLFSLPLLYLHQQKEYLDKMNKCSLSRKEYL